MATDEEAWANVAERIRLLKLILEVSDRFDEFVKVIRRSADRHDGAIEIARTFDCTELDAVLLLDFNVQQLAMPLSIQRHKQELSELEQHVKDRA